MVRTSMLSVSRNSRCRNRAPRRGTSTATCSVEVVASSVLAVQASGPRWAGTLRERATPSARARRLALFEPHVRSGCTRLARCTTTVRESRSIVRTGR